VLFKLLKSSDVCKLWGNSKCVCVSCPVYDEVSANGCVKLGSIKVIGTLRYHGQFDFQSLFAQILEFRRKCLFKSNMAKKWRF
jgi:hypothetical protein